MIGTPPAVSRPRDGWRTATRVCLVLRGVLFLVLLTSGLWLWWNYRPTAAAAWDPDPFHGERQWVRVVHGAASAVSLVLGVVVSVLFVVRRLRGGARGILAAVGVVAAALTGYLLPWDQLALWAVTVGTDMRGAQVVFDARIKYVLIGSRAVSPGTYRFWAVAHVVLGLIVVVAGVLAWSRTRSRTRPREAVATAQD